MEIGSDLPRGITRYNGGYRVRVAIAGETLECSDHRTLGAALEALREARIDAHNRVLIVIDKALEAVNG